MRSRGVLVLAGVLVVVLLTGGGTAYMLSRGVQGSAEETARDYFAAWERGRLDRMAKLVDNPPADFADQHRALSRMLSVNSITFKPGPIKSDPPGKERAHQDFSVSRDIAGRGSWEFRSTLKLGVAGRKWRVFWQPSTLYPGLHGRPTWNLVQIQGQSFAFTDRAGNPLSSSGPLQPYVAALSERFGEDEQAKPGWAIELHISGEKPKRVHVLTGARDVKRIRTTLDPGLQAAAEKAIDTSGEAAIVAVRPSGGEILAVADTLGGSAAFLGTYPPGSTFKAVTAAALLSDGMSPGAQVACPATVVTRQRTIHNADGLALGGTSLSSAFAHSCNTTFAQLGTERLQAGKLTDATRTFGFGGPITPGVPAARGSFPKPSSDAEVAEASIGQGRVQASPLMMALVAAAVADGTWRSPRLVDRKLIREAKDPVQPTREVPNAPALRTLMRAVVTDGTASRAGLPPGTAGKTGTAEVGNGEPDHAWFIGYQADLAFAVFIAGGGSGPKEAAPLAARFLRSR